MKIACLFNYPLVDNTAWKQELLAGLAGEHDLLVLFGRRSPLAHAKAWLARRGETDFSRRMHGDGGERPPRTVAALLRRGIAVRTLAELNGPDAIAALQAFAPDYAFAAVDQILRRPVLEAVPVVLNCHYGVLPEIRGWDAIAWSLLIEGRLSVSLHRMATKVDTGEIYLTRDVAVHPGQDLEAIRKSCQQAAVELYREFFADPDAARAAARPNTGGRQYFAMNRTLKALMERRLRDSR